MRRRKAQRTNQAIMRGVIAMALLVLLVAYLFLTMVSCTQSPRGVPVQGTISDAPDSTLVLEAMTLRGVQPLDSVRLSADGTFSFAVPADSASIPEFYRLRIARRVINFVIDSLAPVTIEAPYARMSTHYDIHGNAASRMMKTISLLNIQLQQRLHVLQSDSALSALEKSERAQQLVDAYKQTLKGDYILKAPASAAAYFALFQTIGHQMLFNPEDDRSDIQFFAAVATQWDQLHPHHPRPENLKHIAFPDIRGRERRLSDFGDNVVLLDFTAYSLPRSQQRNIELRELYAAYHARGLEIYQVSLDADEHFWKTMCEQLPWVCVSCPEGGDNDMVKLYNVMQLPTTFLIGRGSELRTRIADFADLRKAIEAEL